MSAVDSLQTDRNCVLMKGVNPDLPIGISRPKLAGDVGWDLAAMEDVTIGPMKSRDVPVNLQIALPEGFYADVRNRSGMARRGLYVDQNVIDTGYHGPLFVFIRNMQLPETNSDAQNAVIYAGDRIAQLIFHKVHPVWLKETDELPYSLRGHSGFGSTGA